MVLTLTLWDKQNASCAQRETSVLSHLKESRAARTGHTVRMGQVSVLSVQVDTG